MSEDEASSLEGALHAGVVLVACEKLFSGGRGVKKFSRSGVHYLTLAEGAILLEQNPQKRSRWGEMARSGHKIAWVMRDGKYLARVVDGKVTIFGKKPREK